MRDLIILGTGVHAAEMAHLVQRINRVEPTWNFLGHISPRETDQTDFWGYPILGDTEALDNYPDAWLTADNEFPKTVPIPLDRMASLVDPSCFLHPAARIGRGCVVYPGCFIGLNAEIGDRVIMASGVKLAGYVQVDPDVYLGQCCTIRQFLKVGARSLIGMGAVVVKDVPPHAVMAGNPARKLRDKP